MAYLEADPEAYEAPSSLILPALNVLIAMNIEMQDHECVYKPRLAPAIADLEKLMRMMK